MAVVKDYQTAYQSDPSEIIVRGDYINCGQSPLRHYNWLKDLIDGVGLEESASQQLVHDRAESLPIDTNVYLKNLVNEIRLSYGVTPFTWGINDPNHDGTDTNEKLLIAPRYYANIQRAMGLRRPNAAFMSYIAGYRKNYLYDVGVGSDGGHTPYENLTDTEYTNFTGYDIGGAKPYYLDRTINFREMYTYHVSYEAGHPEKTILGSVNHYLSHSIIEDEYNRYAWMESGHEVKTNLRYKMWSKPNISSINPEILTVNKTIYFPFYPPGNNYTFTQDTYDINPVLSFEYCGDVNRVGISAAELHALSSTTVFTYIYPDDAYKITDVTSHSGEYTYQHIYRGRVLYTMPDIYNLYRSLGNDPPQPWTLEQLCAYYGNNDAAYWPVQTSACGCKVVSTGEESILDFASHIGTSYPDTLELELLEFPLLWPL